MNHKLQPEVNANPNHPGQARNRPVHLRDGRWERSSAETGILMAIICHGPTLLSPAEGKPLLYSPGKRDSTYLSGGFSSTYSWCSSVEPAKSND
ncbi:hypothetical protein AVEN_273032-1 [Araneus ventricosus]|uniref:Uncharacterized protein n=1 Tax=Araneus ventricosus TaxID=182803 RepID=A0A4Y2H7E9_ARAVE|nr:hypothetical protein AVEN_273032-1 [Araneus ventricosus]